ncbi:Ig-like domain-containing protein [Vagococcus sp. BWB3-3]|uniref:Ig-like domain-containing protein n=1 Tax=Vagococcus allomyrinae TaxID=2794353 RepID=A0A940PD31_9ENTE|nr:Ig-like domain-containing protein [Vagococcus allomyrinae]MBP1042347.1 Ig-like domain-containing protein [Vagococcus allomyrinae]
MNKNVRGLCILGICMVFFMCFAKVEASDEVIEINSANTISSEEVFSETRKNSVNGDSTDMILKTNEEKELLGKIVDFSKIENLIILSINKERQEKNLAPLFVNEELDKAATIRSAEELKYIVETGNYLPGHMRPDGSSWQTVFNEINYQFALAGELRHAMMSSDIGSTEAWASAIFNSWKNSTGHHTIYMDPTLKELAISVDGVECDYQSSMGPIRVVRVISTALLAKPKNYVEGASLTINSDRTTIPLNGSTQLQAIITPNNATFKDIVWASSDEKIAKVDKNGVMYGVAEGSVVITAEHVSSRAKDQMSLEIRKVNNNSFQNSQNMTVNNWVDYSDQSYLHYYKFTPEKTGKYYSLADQGIKVPLMNVYNEDRSILISSVSEVALEKGKTYYITIRGGESYAKKVIISDFNAGKINLESSFLKLGESKELNFKTSLGEVIVNAPITWTKRDTYQTALEPGKITGTKRGTTTITAKLGQLELDSRQILVHGENEPADFDLAHELTVNNWVDYSDQSYLHYYKFTPEKTGKYYSLADQGIKVPLMNVYNEDRSILISSVSEVMLEKGKTYYITIRGGESYAKKVIVSDFNAGKINLESSFLKLGESKELNFKTSLGEIIINAPITWTKRDTYQTTLEPGKITGTKRGTTTITAKLGQLELDSRQILVHGENEPADFDLAHELTVNNWVDYSDQSYLHYYKFTPEKTGKYYSLADQGIKVPLMNVYNEDRSILISSVSEVALEKGKTYYITIRGGESYAKKVIISDFNAGKINLESSFLKLGESKELNFKTSLGEIIVNAPITWKKRDTYQTVLEPGKIIGTKQGTTTLTASLGQLTLDSLEISVLSEK